MGWDKIKVYVCLEIMLGFFKIVNFSLVNIFF